MNDTIAGASPVDQTVRQPLGLRPEWVAQHQHCRDRLIEIAEAMTRYAEAGKAVPVEWCRELERRIADYVPPCRGRPNARLTGAQRPQRTNDEH